MSSRWHRFTLAAATTIVCAAAAQTESPSAPSRTSDTWLEHHAVVEPFMVSAGQGPSFVQQAEAFAEAAVKYGWGFDPNNPRHRRIAQEAKDPLKAVFLAAHDGRDGSTKLTSGAILTDAQLRCVLQDAQVVLSTHNINGDGGTASGGWTRGTREDGTVGNTFRIDIDHPNIGLLSGHFRSIDEAISFAVLHEMGHAINSKYGEDMPSEDVANYYALAVGRELGLRMPTNAEVTDGAGYSIWTF